MSRDSRKKVLSYVNSLRTELKILDEDLDSLISALEDEHENAKAEEEFGLR